MDVVFKRGKKEQPKKSGHKVTIRDVNFNTRSQIFRRCLVLKGAYMESKDPGSGVI